MGRAKKKGAQLDSGIGGPHEKGRRNLKRARCEVERGESEWEGAVERRELGATRSGPGANWGQALAKGQVRIDLGSGSPACFFQTGEFAACWQIESGWGQITSSNGKSPHGFLQALESLL